MCPDSFPRTAERRLSRPQRWQVIGSWIFLFDSDPLCSHLCSARTLLLRLSTWECQVVISCSSFWSVESCSFCCHRAHWSWADSCPPSCSASRSREQIAASCVICARLSPACSALTRFSCRSGCDLCFGSHPSWTKWLCCCSAYFSCLWAPRNSGIVRPLVCTLDCRCPVPQRLTFPSPPNCSRLTLRLPTDCCLNLFFSYLSVHSRSISPTWNG